MSGQQIPGQAMGLMGPSGVFQKATKHLGNFQPNFNTKDIRTPGWQMLWKVIIFLVLIIVFGGIYHSMISNNPEEWSHPTDENGDPIVNGFYVSTIINSTVGYGDYYPYSSRAITLVVINILITWIVFTVFLG